MMRDVTLMTLIMRNLTDLFRFLALPPRAREMRAERAAVQAQLSQAYQAGRISSD
jgi:hypothetical protein